MLVTSPESLVRLLDVYVRLELPSDIDVDPSCFAPALHAASLGGPHTNDQLDSPEVSPDGSTLPCGEGDEKTFGSGSNSSSCSSRSNSSSRSSRIISRSSTSTSAQSAKGERQGDGDGACATAAQVNDSESVLSVALLHAMENDAGVVPNARCINVAMEACTRAGDWDEVLNLFDGMATQQRGGDGMGATSGKEEENAPQDKSVVSRIHGTNPKPGLFTLRVSAAVFENPTNPTVASYYYAILACRGQVERLLLEQDSCDGPIDEACAEENIDSTRRTGLVLESNTGARLVARARGKTAPTRTVMRDGGVSPRQRKAECWAEHAADLVRRMKDSDLVLRPEALQAAKDTCVTAGMWGLATELDKMISTAASDDGGLGIHDGTSRIGRKVGRGGGMNPRRESGGSRRRDGEGERRLREHGARVAEQVATRGRQLRLHEEQY